MKQSEINQSYSNLCVQLGDLCVKQAEIQAHIQHVMKQVDALKLAVPDKEEPEVKPQPPQQDIVCPAVVQSAAKKLVAKKRR